MIESPGCLLNYQGANKQFTESMGRFLSATLPPQSCGVVGCDLICEFIRDKEKQEIVPVYSAAPCEEQK